MALHDLQRLGTVTIANGAAASGAIAMRYYLDDDEGAETNDYQQGYPRRRY